jgi:hypothetical protein
MRLLWEVPPFGCDPAHGNAVCRVPARPKPTPIPFTFRDPRRQSRLLHTVALY